MQHVYIGLGSNLDNPNNQIVKAVSALRELPLSRYMTDSGLFLSKPMQLPGDTCLQPDYYNAVALIETQLTPVALLDCLQSIENQQGRVREAQWSSRTLDLDILLFGNLRIDSERLQVPHPGMCEREFVLYPLQNINQALEIPGHGKLKQCIQKCSQNGLQYIGSIGECK